MRFLKWVGYLIGGILALCALGIALVTMFFDPNEYKGDIERLTQTHLQRRLTLQGDLKLSFFPWLAVELGAAQLGERPGFGEQPFVSVEQARLSLRFASLLRGAVEIGDVQLVKPSIRLVTDELGRHNWGDLAGEGRAQPPQTDASAKSGPMRANIASLKIRDAMLVIDNRKDKTRTTIRDFSLSTGSISSTRPFDLKIDFVMEQDQRPAVPFKLAAMITTDFDRQQYRLQDCSLATQWFKGDGGGVPLTARLHSVALDVLEQTLALEGMEVELGGAKVSGGLTGKDVFEGAQFSGDLQLAELSPRDLMRDLSMDVPVTRDADVLKHLSFQAHLQATKSSLTLQQMQLKLDDSTATGQLSVADFDSVALQVDLQLDRIDFDRYLPPPQEKPATAAGPANAPTPLPIDLLRALNARGELRIGDAKFSGMRLTQLQVGVNARDGNVQFAPTAAKLYGGEYRGVLGIDASGKLARLTVESHASDVDFAPLFKDMFDTKRASGHGNANVKVSAIGNDTLALQKSLAGAIDFNVRNGAFEGTDLWLEIRRARALLHNEPAPTQAGPARTPFTSCKGTGAIRAGILTNNDLDIAAQYLKVAGQGSVDIVKSTLDYRLTVQVLRTAEAEAEAKDVVDAQIPVKISGTLASPSVKPDVEGLVKARVKQELDKQQDKLRERLRDKLKDILGGKE